MPFRTLEECLLFLEQNKQLVRVKESVDAELQMSAIHLRVHNAGGPALLFENIHGCKYRAASNIFGTLERSKLIFSETLSAVQQLIQLKKTPLNALKNPLQNFSAALAAIKSFPLQNAVSRPVLATEISITDLPFIKHWPMDGGAFITLPQVYTEDVNQPGIATANLGMYRIQLNGNEYKINEEVGLHYQLHRGIGIHQSKANAIGQPLKVSIFVGGPPAHAVAAVMPLPENLSEINFAGILAGRRFRYCYIDGYCISTDADFVITGEVFPKKNKPEGPFGDHLGYYSLVHDFPVMQVHKVYAKKNAIWPFTVVGRPPQEDSSFGALIHEITGNALQDEIPGLKEINAVDAAGVHPLLLAIGSERYTPYATTNQPAEILTIANHILGTGQLSLAKFLFITTHESENISTKNIPQFFSYFFQRINLQRDIHFYTHTTIDTLDYSGTGLNSGSKVVFAAHGKLLRTLATEITPVIKYLSQFSNPQIVLPGVIALQTTVFTTYANAAREIEILNEQLKNNLSELQGLVIILLVDDAKFIAEHLNNFLWVTFTRCNPSHDIHGIGSFTENKHWGCKGPLIFDARIKPHHAAPLVMDPEIEKSIDFIFQKNGSLAGIA